MLRYVSSATTVPLVLLLLLLLKRTLHGCQGRIRSPMTIVVSRIAVVHQLVLLLHRRELLLEQQLLLLLCRPRHAGLNTAQHVAVVPESGMLLRVVTLRITTWWMLRLTQTGRRRGGEIRIRLLLLLLLRSLLLQQHGLHVLQGAGATTSSIVCTSSRGSLLLLKTKGCSRHGHQTSAASCGRVVQRWRLLLVLLR